MSKALITSKTRKIVYRKKTAQCHFDSIFWECPEAAMGYIFAADGAGLSLFDFFAEHRKMRGSWNSVQDRLRSFKVVDFGVNRKRLYDFLLNEQ